MTSFYEDWKMWYSFGIVGSLLAMMQPNSIITFGGGVLFLVLFVGLLFLPLKEEKKKECCDCCHEKL